jgi:hypothetical protein
MDCDEVEYRDWVIEKYGGELPHWLEKIHDKECVIGHCRFCKGGIAYEKYRIDFVIHAKGARYAIEIDGKRFHNKQSKYEQERDSYIQDAGFILIHVPAVRALYNPGKFDYTLRREILGERAIIDGFGELYGF